MLDGIKDLRCLSSWWIMENLWEFLGLIMLFVRSIWVLIRIIFFFWLFCVDGIDVKYCRYKVLIINISF